MSQHAQLTDPRTATDEKAKSEPSERDAGTVPTKQRGLGLSATQIIGGALAAMTAAALGSRLSVAGTVAGAALASVTAAVAGALYTASLRRTQQTVRTVWTARATNTAVPTTIDVIADETGKLASRRSLVDAPVPPARTVTRPRPGGRSVQWKGALVGALVTFSLAVAALTTFELISGHALSGGTGTTIQQVSPGRAARSQEKPTTPETQPTVVASPTPTPSPTASAQPTESTTPEPTPTPSATETPSPSETPSAEPTPTP